MIDEKKLIESLNRGDGMNFRIDLHDFTPEGVGTFLQEYTNKMKECFCNLINAQPNDSGGWIRTSEAQPGMFVSVLIYVPGDSPLPAVHEGYLTDEGNWVSLYHEEYGFDEVPFWMPMPEPPKVGGGA